MFKKKTSGPSAFKPKILPRARPTSTSTSAAASAVPSPEATTPSAVASESLTPILETSEATKINTTVTSSISSAPSSTTRETVDEVVSAPLSPPPSQALQTSNTQSKESKSSLPVSIPGATAIGRPTGSRLLPVSAATPIIQQRKPILNANTPLAFPLQSALSPIPLSHNVSRSSRTPTPTPNSRAATPRDSIPRESTPRAQTPIDSLHVSQPSSATTLHSSSTSTPTPVTAVTRPTPRTTPPVTTTKFTRETTSNNQSALATPPASQVASVSISNLDSNLEENRPTSPISTLPPVAAPISTIDLHAPQATDASLAPPPVVTDVITSIESANLALLAHSATVLASAASTSSSIRTSHDEAPTSYPTGTTAPASKSTRGRKRKTTVTATSDDATPSTDEPLVPKRRQRRTVATVNDSSSVPSTTTRMRRTRATATSTARTTNTDANVEQAPSPDTTHSLSALTSAIDSSSLPLPAPPSPTPSAASTRGDSSRRSRRPRSVTPEDSENQVVDHKTLTMADLTRDLRIGKKFSRHDELLQRERARRRAAMLARKKKRAVLASLPASASAVEIANALATSATAIVPSSLQSSPSSSTPTRTTSVGQDGVTSSVAPISESTEAEAEAGPQFRIVDGQIVVDQSSLLMDRHAQAAALRGDLVEVEENDFTRLITSNSFRTGSKLNGPNFWTSDDTERFYDALQMWGTDFGMIANMFPGRQRRHIKMKFNREERDDPARINSILVGAKTVKIDLDVYKAHTGKEFESVESIEAEQQALAAQHDAELRRVQEEQDEANRKKKEALFADDDTETKAKKKGKRGKAVATFMWGGS